MHNYPSDISREAFEIIRGDLEQAKKGQPRNADPHRPGTDRHPQVRWQSRVPAIPGRVLEI
jgi:hypothetical protein